MGKPSNPMSQLLAEAVQFNELYRTFQSSGFTRQKALYLVGQIITGGGKLPPENLQ
ncbi:hypothetical protein ACFYE2_00595 [Kocuria sp. CPCC 205300]|uniref:hypothetical protein n=1 Tax=Kocuria sabuli TaxID=3071448 RepID=UPI0036DC77C4